MGGRGSASGMNSKLTDIKVWDTADELAEQMVEKKGYSYAKVNRSPTQHKENNIDRVYYSISLFKRKGRKNKLDHTIPLGYFDKKSNKYVPKQVGGYEATNLFEYLRKLKKQ